MIFDFVFGIIGKALGVVSATLLIGLILTWLPVEFDAYTLDEFSSDLASIQTVFLTSLGLFSTYVNVELALSIVKISLWSIFTGGAIKGVIWVFRTYGTAGSE